MPYSPNIGRVRMGSPASWSSMNSIVALLVDMRRRYSAPTTSGSALRRRRMGVREARQVLVAEELTGIRDPALVHVLPQEHELPPTLGISEDEVRHGARGHRGFHREPVHGESRPESRAGRQLPTDLASAREE